MESLTRLITRSVLQAIKDFAYGINAGHAIKHTRTLPAQHTTVEGTQHLSTREGSDEVPLLTARGSTA